MSSPHIMINFGSWSQEIPAESSLEIQVGTDTKVISNATLASRDDKERSTLFINFRKREDEQGGNAAVLCSLIPNGRRSITLGVYLGRREVVWFENTGKNSIVIRGHYTGYQAIMNGNTGRIDSTTPKRPREVSSDNESEEVNQVKKKDKLIPRPLQIEKETVADSPWHRQNEDSGREEGRKKAVGNERVRSLK
ncbi:hypothetical protein EDD18DRAFT_1109598 [Armillaria luteobubalina]|uniref:Nucleoplasmin-like domain-containing protein n=1 Tax=Armillaria luteobubalina TaxID=153913 RepID=A0AA39PXC3_9AGAR|nr:hypothetical protein EDD18DRAFT_1109598 [Armillaria luteobubalina]